MNTLRKESQCDGDGNDNQGGEDKIKPKSSKKRKMRSVILSRSKNKNESDAKETTNEVNNCKKKKGYDPLDFFSFPYANLKSLTVCLFKLRYFKPRT